MTISTATLKVNLLATLVSALDHGTAEFPARDDTTYNFTNGTGANQANNVFADTRTTDNTGESLDFSGVLTNAFGATISATKIKALLITASASNTIDVAVGGAASNQLSSLFGDATDKVLVKPGGMVLFVAPDANGYAVTAGTGDILKVAAASAGNVTYDIIALTVG